MFYEDPAIVGQRLGWAVLNKVLISTYRTIYKPFYDKMKELYGVRHFQLMHEAECTVHQFKRKDTLAWSILVIDKDICLFDFDTYDLITIPIEDVTEIYIKKMPLDNYKIEMFFSLEAEDGQHIRHNLLFQTIVLSNNKLERKYGTELISPRGLISFLKSHPAYKSSL